MHGVAIRFWNYALFNIPNGCIDELGPTDLAYGNPH
jgi:hypothetical protein